MVSSRPASGRSAAASSLLPLTGPGRRGNRAQSARVRCCGSTWRAGEIGIGHCTPPSRYPVRPSLLNPHVRHAPQPSALQFFSPAIALAGRIRYRCAVGARGLVARPHAHWLRVHRRVGPDPDGAFGTSASRSNARGDRGGRHRAGHPDCQWLDDGCARRPLDGDDAVGRRHPDTS